MIMKLEDILNTLKIKTYTSHRMMEHLLLVVLRKFTLP